MKHLNLLLLLLIFYNITALAQSSNPSQTLVDLIQTKKWFEIEDYYQQHKDSIDNEVVQPYYLAMTGEVFNRPYEAINAYEQLIDRNPNKMDASALTAAFGQPVLQLCADVQEYAKGEELCRKLITIFQNDTIVNSETRSLSIQGLTQAIEKFKLAPKEYPKLTIIKNTTYNLSDIKLLQDTSMRGNGIYFNAKWNGINLRTNFDTGASVCYIYNRTIAEKIGVKFNTIDTIILNNGKIRALIGVIDSLELGEFIITDVPVNVNIETIDTADSLQVKCDSILNSAFDIVLGLPVIRHLGIIEFDFVKNTMSFPQKAIAVNKRNLYIDNSFWKTLYMNIEICNTNFLTYFDTGGNEGLSINTDFFEKHKQCISTEVEAKQRKGMVGACNEASFNNGYAYKCPQIDIKINNQVITMVNNCFAAKDKENDNKFGAMEGGFLGNAIFKYCRKATFDFDNMTFNVEK